MGWFQMPGWSSGLMPHYVPASHVHREQHRVQLQVDNKQGCHLMETKCNFETFSPTPCCTSHSVHVEHVCYALVTFRDLERTIIPGELLHQSRAGIGAIRVHAAQQGFFSLLCCGALLHTTQKHPTGIQIQGVQMIFGCPPAHLRQWGAVPFPFPFPFPHLTGSQGLKAYARCL